MAPQEKSQLKRPRASPGSPQQPELDSKKPRRSDRLSAHTPVSHKQQLPSPVTHVANTDSDEHLYKEPTATPPEGRPSQVGKDDSQQINALSSPPQDTQAFSQYPPETRDALVDEVEDEVKEGVWGYLFPLDTRYGKALVMKKRSACPLPETVADKASTEDRKGKSPLRKEEEAYERTKIKGVSSGGYLIGRHPECDIVVDDPIVSNRHCLFFAENKGGDTVAIVEDLSSNGTFVNEAIVGRNQRRELNEQDEIAVLGKARFIFRYPKTRQSNGFLASYTLLERLGKGHFAEVFLCIEKSTGQRYAVKIFTKTPGMQERSKQEGLQQEIAVLMGVSHPNVLCLKDTFDEPKAVYLVLELAPEGELFNFIVMKQKLTEAETRKLFTQLFQGIKYLHDRNIVHRDIKPENILMVDKDLHVKLADFGLAKIIGEESFTTTLCGTPSYVAPEILADTKHRKYTKAVDIWSLGVVLYICLCGFPPFSDELFSRDFPYTLSQQIKSGRFDYPSPYWDSVGDPALDLIDSMLVVDPERRFTIDQCLSHPWMTQGSPNVADSTDGLVGGIKGLEVHRRGVVRERTLLSTLNSVQVTAKVSTGEHKNPVKIFSKNTHKIESGKMKGVQKEAGPAHNQAPGAFMQMGDKGDGELFANDGNSVYSKTDLATDKRGQGHRPRQKFTERTTIDETFASATPPGSDLPRTVQAIDDDNMAAGATQNAQPQLLFVDGSFPELANEMAAYLKITEEVEPLLDSESKKDEILSKLVRASSTLSTVPEKEYTAASNLMIHLVMQADEPKKHLPALCQAFSKPPTTSPANGVGLSLNALTTVFNLIDPKNPIRFNVFSAILNFLKSQGAFDVIEPYLKHLPTWFDDWNTGEEFQRNMYVNISELASEAGRETESYDYLLKALRTFDADDKEEISSEEAQELSLRAVRQALLSSTHLLFTDICSIPSVQNLSETHPVWSQLLVIFAENDLEDYNDFNDEHEGFLEKEDLDGDRLLRKMRLLTFASVAAQTTSRRIEYSTIARALQVPSEDVEMWAIDVIRAGLVEGKLSQQDQVFLVHKVTYRVFGTRQWQELATRLDSWRSTLNTLVEVVRKEEGNARAQKEREVQELERKLQNAGIDGGSGGGNRQRGGGRRDGGQREPKEPREPKVRTDDDD